MPSLRKIFWEFLKLGLSSFGGPAMVAFIRDLAVNRQKWVPKETFNEGVAIAQAVPGATAMQMATFVGLKTRGIIGGLVSFLGFSLPAFVLMMLLSWFYKENHTLTIVHNMFQGLRLAVVAIVGKAFLDFFLPISRKAKEILIAALSFVLFFEGVNPFLIIFSCFLLSYLIFTEVGKFKHQASKVNLKKILGLITVPFVFLGIFYLINPKYFNLSQVMMKVDAFAFGGGYACLPLMLHQVVDKLHWMTKEVFMDGIALGQVTPGPIVITATFVGFYLYGIIGGIIATISIFTPSFIIISIASELQERIRYSTWFLRAKRGLIASFSGLLLFAELKFLGGVHWTPLSAIIATIFLVALLKRVNILWVVFSAVIFSLFIHF
ncbi:MAG: chromate efflux transporter [Thermodesulfobacteria bacterium]|nr:chromate efflux transporter [Thermodesulfobacteriota bacterium]